MRNIDAGMLAALESGLIRPVILAALSFRSATRYIWTGVGNLVFAGNTYVGIGSFGGLGQVKEGVDDRVDNLQISLSGIDPIILGESLTDIQQGAPATVYFGLMSDTGTLLGPYQLFGGVVDTADTNVGADTATITLTLESLMVDGQRPSMRRYTSADQRIQFPDDTAFGWVEQLNDLALIWGQ
jgi:hypothetical protein